MTKDDLLRLIPDFLHDIQEFNEICSAFSAMASKFEDKAKQQEADFYIYSEDITENAVDRLAKSIKTDVSGLSFEDKVFKIKTELLDKRPYNIPNVKKMLFVLCGEDGYTFDVNNDSASVLVKLDLGRKHQFDAVFELLDKVIPANMVLNVELLYNMHSDLTGMTHEALKTKTHKQIRSDVL